MDDLTIQKLHAELALINNKYESIAKATGSNYNIFQVLRIETKEVTTHSRMIGDLLNPIGSHGMGSQFLKLFLESIKMDIPSNLESVVCTVEKNYGLIDHENTKGGSIDIIIEGGGVKKPLVIENKIYAGDGDNQLLRYYNQLNRKCEIFYLTLFGKEPTAQSKGGEEFEVKIISYNDHILEWLKDCHELSIDRPLLRETLKQYINIVKHLTGQSMNDDKNKEIFDFIEKNKDSLKELHFHMNSFVNNHLDNLIPKVFDEIVKDQPLNLLAVKPTLLKHEGHLVCHFKFGNKEKGVVFELKTSPNELSLWTTAWRWEENIPYGGDSSLIEALNGWYNAPLDSRLSIEELTKEVVKGINASEEYCNTLYKK